MPATLKNIIDASYAYSEESAIILVDDASIDKSIELTKKNKKKDDFY